MKRKQKKKTSKPLRSTLLSKNQQASQIIKPNVKKRAKSLLTKPKVPSWQQPISTLAKMVDQDASLASLQPKAEYRVLYVVNTKLTLSNQILTIEVLLQQKHQDEWATPVEFNIPRHRINSLLDTIDQQLITLLYSLRDADRSPVNYHNRFYSSVESPHIFKITSLQLTIIPFLCQTGRCFIRSSNRSDLDLLHYDNGPAWEFSLEIKERSNDYQIVGVLKRADIRRELSEFLLLLSCGLVFFSDSVAHLNDHQSFPWINMLRKEGPLTIPRTEIDDFLNNLLIMKVQPPFELPEHLKFEQCDGSPQPRLIIKRKVARRNALEGLLYFSYGNKIIFEKDTVKGIFDSETRRFLLRNWPAESAAKALLINLGFKPQQNIREDGLDLPVSLLSQVVRVLTQANWYVEAEGKIYRNSQDIKIEIKTKLDWFELRGNLDFGESSADITALLDALKHKRDYVRLDDGSCGLLPEEWLKRYGLIAGLGNAKEEHLRFNRAQIGFLDTFISSRPEIKVDAEFAQARKQLEQFNGIEPLDPPKSFAGHLREYQREGLGWLHFLQHFSFGGCLADDMGLGKTIEALALLESRRLLRTKKEAKTSPVGPSLVVVPKSLIFNWQREAAHFTPNMQVLKYAGQQRVSSTRSFKNYDLILTTYGTLQRDINKLQRYKFDYIILDESQAIKNATTKTAQAVRRLTSNYRLALSGTPVENHLGELWSLFEFLNPGLLGTSEVFQRLSATSSEDADKETRSLIARALKPFMLRRTKDQVAKDLPEKLEQTLYCEMETEQKKFYNQIRDHYRQKLLKKIAEDGLQRSKIFVLEALLRLRQAACHPGLIDKKKRHSASAKLELLLPHLREIVEEGHKVLVFSQFTSMLAIVREHLERENLCYEYLDGRTQNRAAKVDRFQSDDECKLFLISLKAGGYGLNLTAAEYVFILDPWWNPAVEAQAIDRSHRIGQQHRVFAYRLIVRDTVEEKVVELQNRKRELVNAIISEDNSLIRAIKVEDLELLLS